MASLWSAQNEVASLGVDAVEERERVGRQQLAVDARSGP